MEGTCKHHVVRILRLGMLKELFQELQHRLMAELGSMFATLPLECSCILSAAGEVGVK